MPELSHTEFHYFFFSPYDPKTQANVKFSFLQWYYFVVIANKQHNIFETLIYTESIYMQ